jgi:hypothetical protein
MPLNFITTTAKIPFFTYKVENHSELKSKILEEINKLKVQPVFGSGQRIWNSDYYLKGGDDRPYVQLVKPMLTDLCKELTEILEYKGQGVLEPINIWYQQYKPSDIHYWHVHRYCFYCGVYYVDLQGETPKTTFKCMEEEFQFEVEEGQILFFPSFLLHQSKKNLSNKTKTVIAFNVS